MEFIKQIRIMGKIFHEISLESVIVVLSVKKTVVLKKSLRIDIDDKYRFIKGVENDTISRFFADAVYGEQFFS